MRKYVKKMLSLLTTVTILTGLSFTTYAIEPVEFVDSDRLEIK